MSQNNGVAISQHTLYVNSGSEPVEINGIGYKRTLGTTTYRFNTHTPIKLQPGQRIVVVSDEVDGEPRRRYYRVSDGPHGLTHERLDGEELVVDSINGG